MDRKGIIAVIIAIVVLVVWEVRFAPKAAPVQAAASPSPSAAASVPGAPASTGGTAVAISASQSAMPAAAPVNVPEQLTEAVGPAAKYRFTNLGGGIAQAELTGYPAAVSGSNVDLNEYGKLPIGALSFQPGVDEEQPYTVTRQGNTVTCVRDEPGGLSITKKFTLPASVKDAHGYKVTLDVTFTNHGAQPVQKGGYYLYLGSAGRILQNEIPFYTAFDWDAEGRSQHIDTSWFDAHHFLFVVQTQPAQEFYTQDAEKVDWAAVSSQYFTNVISVRGQTSGAGVWATRMEIPIKTRSPYGIEGALRLPAFTVPPKDGTVENSFDLYLGPKLFATLEGMGGGQERIVSNYFSLYGMAVFRPISIFLLNALNVLHSWTGSYALAIILITLCIRVALWPLQNKATASMRQMQELSPRMNELKEKYKDDPTRMNQEVMKLYKEYNVNPLSGCLPMFIQIPIFFGFYRVLGTAIELRNSTFLWVKDLSQPDTLFHLPSFMGGYPVNILPLFMAVTMLFQMSLTPKTGDKSQQRMFMFMPLIFVLFCYNFASALALYWTVQNVFSIVQLYVTRKRTAPAPLKPVAAKRRNR